MACELYALGERLYISLLASAGRDMCSYGLFQWRGAVRSCHVSAASVFSCKSVFLPVQHRWDCCA